MKDTDNFQSGLRPIGLMKLGLGFYRHQQNAEHYRFAQQAGCTHVVVHMIDYFRGSRRGAMSNDPARKQKILSRTPMAHFGQPEDIGWAVAYLCSPAARFVTGACQVVDGGISIGF